MTSSREPSRSGNGSGLKRIARGTARHFGFRITRLRHPMRFDAMEDTFLFMRGAGYRPRVVLDAGANMGLWAAMIHSVFPAAHVHMIEPQPGCAGALEELTANVPRFAFHRLALTRPGVSEVRMIGSGRDRRGTGAYVAESAESGPDEIRCPATTLDALFAGDITRDDRALLKLDLEGHELEALRGASHLLDVVEVIVTELQFFEINGNGRPVFADVIAFLREKHFEIYDFACLSPRPRDLRLRMGDVVFVRADSPLLADRQWE